MSGEMMGKQRYEISSFNEKEGKLEYYATPINISGGKTGSIAIVIPATVRERFRDQRLRVKIEILERER